MCTFFLVHRKYKSDKSDKTQRYYHRPSLAFP